MSRVRFSSRNQIHAATCPRNVSLSSNSYTTPMTVMTQHVDKQSTSDLIISTAFFDIRLDLRSWRKRSFTLAIHALAILSLISLLQVQILTRP